MLSNAEVGAYLRAHTTEQDSIYAMYANAGLYFAADRRPASPYLWWLNLVEVPGAIDQLAVAFNGPDAPRYVARYGEADSLPGGDAINVAIKTGPSVPTRRQSRSIRLVRSPVHTLWLPLR